MQPFARRGIEPRWRTSTSTFCTNGVTVEDEDGVDLLNAATALLEAARTAAEMMRDRCADKAEPADVCIIVRGGSPEPAAP